MFFAAKVFFALVRENEYAKKKKKKSPLLPPRGKRKEALISKEDFAIWKKRGGSFFTWFFSGKRHIAAEEDSLFPSPPWLDEDKQGGGGVPKSEENVWRKKCVLYDATRQSSRLKVKQYIKREIQTILEFSLLFFCGNCKDVREGGWHVTTKEEEEEGRNTHTPA